MSTEPRRIKKIVRAADRMVAPSIDPKRGELTVRGTPRLQTVEGFVTLPQLAVERKIQQQLARIWVKNAGIKKPGARWQWKVGSKELARVRKALELP